MIGTKIRGETQVIVNGYVKHRSNDDDAEQGLVAGF
jgi:hypothetical protein